MSHLALMAQGCYNKSQEKNGKGPMRIQLAYGRTGIEVEMPADAPITIIEPRAAPGLSDEPAAILAALRAPLGRPPLRDLVSPKDTVAIVFSDLTRPMPNDRVLPPLLAELAQAGVPDDHVALINALGTHRPQNDAELEQMLGQAITNRYQIVQHDALDERSLVPVTRNHAGHLVSVNRAYTMATVRILTGFIEPHLFAGFSGGPKAVLPGIAGLEAILDNHGPAMIAHPNATWAVTVGNPIWEEMLAVAQATTPTFVLNVTLNSERAITAVLAGELRAVHHAGAELVRAQAMQPIPAPFDVVLTSNSGYPLDLNLYQAVKGMSAAAQIVRPGGNIVIAAECWDGIPDHGEYKRLLWAARSPQELLDRVLAPGFRCRDQWEAQVQAQIQLKAQVHVHASGLSDEELRRALVIPCPSIEARIGELCRERPGATIAVLPDGPQTIPYVQNTN